MEPVSLAPVLKLFAVEPAELSEPKLAAEHDGFNLHAALSFEANERVAIERLCREPGDVERLRAVLERVMARPELAREVGRRAVERVRRQFTAQREAQQFLEIYRCEDSPPLGQPGLQHGNDLG